MSENVIIDISCCTETSSQIEEDVRNLVENIIDSSIKSQECIDNMFDGTQADLSTNPFIRRQDTNGGISVEDGTNIPINIIPYPKKLGYKEVEVAVQRAYNTSQDYYSSAFDIIASYIKAQKILYMEAFTHCTTRLNYLMLPAIFLSALASVLALATDTFPWGSVAVSGVNAFNGFLLSVISYSKYDAASEAHKITSHQYDKLQSMCEFTSGCMMILGDNDDNLDKTAKIKLDEIETKIKEIKETNGFIIPEAVRKLFPKIYNINLFSKIKSIYYEEIVLIDQVKNHLNTIRHLEYLYKTEGLNETEKNELKHHSDKARSLIYGIIQLKNEYSKFEDLISKEIKKAFEKKKTYITRMREGCLRRCFRNCVDELD